MTKTTTGRPWGFVHMTATKDYVAGLIKKFGPESVGLHCSEDEALRLLRKDPREVIPCGECDNQDERGYCQGHKRGQSPPS